MTVNPAFPASMQPPNVPTTSPTDPPRVVGTPGIALTPEGAAQVDAVLASAGHLTAPLPRHPAVTSILKHFDYAHLPEHLQEISREVHALAHAMADQLQDDPELTAGLRWLLLAKDSFVRAALSR